MPVVLLLAAVAILGGVVVVALGRGGELAAFRSDTPPYPREFVTAAQMAAFRPPAAFLGYSAQVTDDALQRIARVVAERDTEIARLRAQLAALQAGAARPDPGQDPDRGQADYPGAEYPGAELPGAELPGAEYRGAEFPGAEYRGAEFPGAEYRGDDGAPGATR